MTYFSSKLVFHGIWTRYVLYGLSLFFAIFNLGNTYAQESSWEKPFIGSDPTLLYYPDQNAVYFRYGWENNKQQGIIIKGKMPDARYFSFNLYNDYTKSSIIALADYEIMPDESDASSYTIHIMPEGKAGKFPNLIIIPDSIKIASVFLRYYLPRGNIYANRPLPLINLVENGNIITVISSIPQASLTNADLAKLKKVIEANPKVISSKERKLLSSAATPMQEKEPIISKVMTAPIFPQ